MTRRTRSNPAWSDQIAHKNCDAIQAACKEFKLPEPILTEKCKIEGELGFGEYGAVYSTVDPSVVVKITSDESEAHMIALAISMREVDGIDPKGLVRYDAIFALPNKRDGSQTYILWRESAKSIGLFASESSSCEIKDFEDHLIQYYKHADEAFFMSAAAAKNMDVEEYWAWMKSVVDAANSILDGKTRDIPFVVPKFSRYLAKAYAACEKMEENTKSFWVGECLRTLMKAGLLVGDAHLNNVGVVERGRCGGSLYVLTDPGHTAPLRRKLSQVEIPMIGGSK